MDRLTLKPEKFYGWTMYPGYGDVPYRSPIQVEEIVPLGGRKYDLAFLNLFYAAGVQMMTYHLRTLRRERTYIVAEEVMDGETTDRVVIIENLSADWIETNVPSLSGQSERLFDTSGEPVEGAMLNLMSRGSS